MTRTRNTRAAHADLRILLLAAGVLFIARIVPAALNHLYQGVPASRVPLVLGPWAFHWILVTLVLVPGFLLAQRASASRGRAVPYTLVVLAGSALIEALMVPLASWIFMRPFPHRPMILIDTTMRMGLAAFVFAAYREQREAVEVVQTLETRRNEMMGRLAASRLQTARARVQPEAFIEELQAIRASYVLNPATAEVGLEALITRLRAASRSAVP
jgi:hypothetical protein